MRLAVLILAALLAAPALAGEAKAPEKAQEKAPEPGTSVEMPYLIAPMTVDGRLVAYAYISSKIVASSPSAAIEVRLKLAFIQDAFVRDVNGAPIALASDPTRVDEKAVTVRLLADARRIVGAAKVADLKLIQVQISPMRPNPQG
ncbi:MAG TPA: hypothetical protein VMH86_14415 [Rhizomicrobium sp.]|nr:hypothetical protein [Rhizomicrobium sp.]